MKSAGNDIVALTAVNPWRSISPDFYSKFIIPAEQDLYKQSSAMETVPFCSFVWLLWSVKEAAYKYHKRLQPELIFSPCKFVVENIDDLSDCLAGSVTFGGVRIFYNSWLTDEYIETVVDEEEIYSDPCNYDVYHRVIKIDQCDAESQSVAVRNLIVQDLYSAMKLKDLIISKADAGYPIIIQTGKILAARLSFAHHDHFVGYSYRL